jgi:hypothetical protein
LQKAKEIDKIASEGKKMNPEITEPEEATPTTNAVSLFGQGGGPNDFPVLKAFQEYIDAEQAKARKRMLGLCVFFILLLVVIVVTFTVVISSVINRNQSLSDRLLDIALREKMPAQPVVNVQSPAPAPVVQPVVQPVVHQTSQEETLKPVLEKFDKLAEALAKVQQQVPVPQPAPVVVTTSPSPVVQPSSESAEILRLREELRREKEERKAEKEAKEKEEKRKAEIEAHRRRLYPEYYAQQDARKAALAETEISERPAETVRRAPSPLPDLAPQTTPPPVRTTQAPVPAPVATSPRQPVAPTPRATPSVRPSPAIAPSAQPLQQDAKKSEKLQPRSYFSNSVPGDDPELKELLKNVPPPATPVPQTKSQAPSVPQQAEPAAKPVAKPVARLAEPAPKPVAKPVPQPVAKPAPQPAVQSPSQPAPKQVATQVPTPAVQFPEQNEKKTETLAIGGADGNSIPWLIEVPQN